MFSYASCFYDQHHHHLPPVELAHPHTLQATAGAAVPGHGGWQQQQPLLLLRMRYLHLHHRRTRFLQKVVQREVLEVSIPWVGTRLARCGSALRVHGSMPRFTDLVNFYTETYLHVTPISSLCILSRRRQLPDSSGSF